MNTQMFPTLYGCAVLKDDAFWQKSFDHESETSCRDLIEYCESEFVEHGTVSSVLVVASAAINDLIILKQAAHIVDIFDFLQFVLSTLVANFVVNNKITGYTYNWIANSLAEEVSEKPVRELVAERIFAFFDSSHDYIRKELIDILSTWCHAVYYYSRITGGHIPIAKGFLEDYGDFYLMQVVKAPSPQMISSTCDILAWCISNSETFWQEKISNLLLRIYNSPQCPATYKKIIAMQFSCVSEHTGNKSPQQWSEEVLSTYANQLKPFEKVQVLTNSIYQDATSILDKMDELLSSIDEYFAAFEVPQTQTSELGYELSRAFEVITPVLLTLLKADNGTAAYTLLARFFHINKPLNNPEELLHIVPNDKEGPLYHLHPHIISEGQDTSERYIQLVQMQNKFLQTSIFLTGLPEYTPTPPNGERIGTPSESDSAQYIKLLSEHFRFNEIDNKMTLKAASAYYLYSSINFPLQALMVKQLGFSIPMAQSAQQPDKIREIKKALIWQDDSLTSEPECSAVVKILNNGGIATTLLSAHDTSIEKFKVCYESNEYDFIYISGHGQHEHYEPHNSYIQLSRTIQLNIDTIRRFQNNWMERRLAFLNICDGATTALFNNPASLGMSPLLVHSKQSVISHLWPVAPMVAMLWGIVVATCVVRKLSYAEIYQEAVSKMLTDKEDIITYLTPYVDEEILERVKNIEIDLKNFSHWGSLAHFE